MPFIGACCVSFLEISADDYFKGYLLKLYIINFNSGHPPIRDVPVS